ncbi:crosslink repair DNA glycosylase YcaQ family protein [Micromonospora chokoriensis]
MPAARSSRRRCTRARCASWAPATTWTTGEFRWWPDDRRRLGFWHGRSAPGVELPRPRPAARPGRGHARRHRRAGHRGAEHRAGRCPVGAGGARGRRDRVVRHGGRPAVDRAGCPTPLPSGRRRHGGGRRRTLQRRRRGQAHLRRIPTLESRWHRQPRGPRRGGPRMRAVVTRPTVKGDVSGRLATMLPKPYLRSCRPCDATHLYEMPFRLAAVRAGLELQLDTSPPILRRIAGFTKAPAPGDRFDLIRAYLRLLGPATPKQVADYLDAPVKDVKALWPRDVVEVTVDGEVRSLLAADEPALESADGTGTRLLGPYDLFLQAKDRATLVPDAAHAKELWPVLGRPGAVLVDGELVGTWRPRKSGRTFTVAVQPWQRLSGATRDAITAQAEHLAAHRAVSLAGVEFAS